MMMSEILNSPPVFFTVNIVEPLYDVGIYSQMFPSDSLGISLGTDKSINRMGELLALL
jgi:hypothetical protein